ncbi:MAG TPA: J domain-containing protein [Tepidimicrobium sp.]|nr:J domain-containing protein [Tepidimicrobium sp.]
MKDYYKILEINPNSTKDEIRKAYRRLAKQWHPDMNKSENAHDKFIEITEAYEILIDDHNRAHYDAMRNNTYYSKNESDFYDKQEEARSKGEYYSSISFEEFLLKAFEVIAEVGKATLFGEDEFNRSITFKNYIGIGLRGWLSVLLLILSFTGVLAPITIPVLLKMNLIDKGRIIGIKNIFIGMFIAMGVILAIIFGIYTIVNVEYIVDYIYFDLSFYCFEYGYKFILLIVCGIFILVYIYSGRMKLKASIKKVLENSNIKNFVGLVLWVLSIICMIYVESDSANIFSGLIALGLSILLFLMGTFHWLFMSKYKNFFIRLVLGIIFIILSVVYMDILI